MRWSRRDVYGQLLKAAVSDWEIPDDRSFAIRLGRPFPTLLNALAKVDNPAFIMPERLARTDASQQVTEVVGSGPYRFVAAGGRANGRRNSP